MNTKMPGTKTFYKIPYSILICTILVAAILSLYWQTHNHEFINYDDGKYISENVYVQEGLNFKSIAWAFTSTRSSNWHPLTWLSHMLDIQLFGMKPGMHHLVNVFIHIANTLLLFYILNKMTCALWKSAIITAFFAIHPIHVESVAWASERKDVLGAFFWMLTIGGYTRYVKRQNLANLLVSLLFFILGLMAKPMLVTLPFVLFLIDYWPLNRFRLKSLNKPGKTNENPFNLGLVLEKIPFLFFSILSCVVTFIVQKEGGAMGSFDVIPFDVRLTNAVVSYVNYIGKMFFPANLSILYPHPLFIPLWQVVASIFAIIAMIYLAVKQINKRPYIAIGLFWYLGTLVPVIGIVQVGTQAMADRYTYIPLIGLFIIITWGVSDLTQCLRHKRIILTTISVIAIASLITITWIQIGYWKSSVTLFEHSIAATTNNSTLHNNIGTALAEQEKYDNAIEHYNEAIDINKNRAEFHNNLANALAAQGKYDNANLSFTEALKLNPKAETIHYNFARTLSANGQNNEAIEHYMEALQIKPGFKEANKELGNLLISLERYSEAIDFLSKSLISSQNNAETYYKLGIAFANQGIIDKVISSYTKAIEIKPDFIEAHNNLGNTFASIGKQNEAIYHFSEALKINPDNADLHINIAILLQKRQNFHEAIEHYKRVIQLNPDNPQPYNNIAYILQTTNNQNNKDSADAIKYAKKACELTNYVKPNYMDTLAGAYGKSKQYQEALQTAQEAKKIATEKNLKSLINELDRKINIYKSSIH